MTGDEKRAVLGLWCATGVGPQSIGLVALRHGGLEAIVDLPITRWLSSVPLHEPAREGLLRLSSLGDHADAELERAHALGMSIAFAGEPQYPRGLAGIKYAPPLLFYKGRGDRDNGPRRLAMVGSRHFEPNFRRAVTELATELARRLIIVSGAADGIDQLSHRAALSIGGETWAFMGSALDQLDPPQQRISEEMLARGGTIFSEFPSGVRPERKTFPRRNRLISGASDAVLVLRANLKSGAIHTVRYAKNQGRLVLALPGQIDHPTAQGCNRLIRTGVARLAQNAADVFADMGLTRTLSAPAQPSAPAVEVTSLSANAQVAFEAVHRAAADFDQVLSRAPSLNSGQLASALIELELAGLLVQGPGRRYERR